MSKYLDEIGVKYLWGKTTAKIDSEIAAVKAETSSVYRPKGSVADIEALKAIPEDDLKVGDVYNLRSNGMNYLWTGDKENPDYDDGWDALGSIIKIPTLTVEDIDKIFSEVP